MFTDDHPFLSFWTGIFALFLLIGVLILVGWQAGWWFQVQNAKRQGQIQNIQSHNIRNGYSNQQTLREQITKDIQDIDQIGGELPFVTADQKPPLELQRKAEVNTLCQQASEVTGDPLNNQQSQFVSANCNAGSISTTSKYWVP